MTPDTAIQPTPRVTRVDTVADRIREIVETQSLCPGDKLPGELELAERLSVSRTVVREAISRLQSVGLLTVTHGRSGGTFVGNRDSVMSCARVVATTVSVAEKDIAQFAEFRAALEVHAAKRAAEAASDADIADLKRLCGAIVSPTTDERSVAADYEFHHRLAVIGGNTVILHTLEVSREIIKSMIRDTGVHDAKRNRQKHQAIVDAIQLRDPIAAGSAMQDHMDDVIRELTA